MLSSSEFAASQRRLEARALEHTERERRKADKQRILAERQAAREKAREDEARQRRLALLAAEEEERRQHAAELEANNGVFYHATLTAVPAPEAIAASKGIRRAADKILLPPSAGASLMDAYKNGPMFFRISTPAGTATHAGLLEFSAAEGESAVFQPRSASFQDVGDGIRDVLEAALLQHSCLSCGDWLAVEHAPTGQSYDLKVCGLSPAPAVSIIDTDLEAEISPSFEQEERIREQYEAAAQRAAEAALAAAAAARQQQAAEAAAVEAAAHRERVRLAKEAALPPEPPAGLAVMFRFPDGGRHTRRFMLNSPLQLLFDFVDSKGGSGMAPGAYNLVTQFPRRVFSLDAPPAASAEGAAGPAQTLQSAGLVGPREVLFLEPRSGSLEGEAGSSGAAGGAAGSSGGHVPGAAQ